MKVNAYNAIDRVKSTEKPAVSEKSGDKSQPKAGELIKGEILDLNQSTVKIKLESGQIIQARLTDAFEMNIGQQVQFYVKEMDSEHWILKPMLEEGVMTADKLKLALLQAGINATDENMEIVKKMIQSQMSVDRESLQKTIQTVRQFPDESLDHILFLVKHDMPVNSENLKQLQSMIKGDQQLLTRLTDISAALSEKAGVPEMRTLVTSLVTTPGGKAAIAQIYAALDAWEGGTSQETGEANINSLQNNADELYQDIQKKNVPLNVLNAATIELLQTESVRTSASPVPAIPLDPVASPLLTSGFLSLSDAGELTDTILNLTKGDAIVAQALLAAKDPEDFANLLKRLELPLDTKQYLMEALTDKAVYRQLTRELLMNENQLESPKALRDFYDNLQDKLQEIVSARQGGEGRGSVSGEAAKANAHLGFMADLNEKFNYLQLPFLLNDRLTHSELYVFNKKPQLKNPKATITALVRLDLVNMGHVDTYITKTGPTVNLQFYTEDDEKRQLLEPHISKLHNRLQAAGFKITGMGVSASKKDFDVLEDFLGAGKETQDVKRYTFDMRA